MRYGVTHTTGSEDCASIWKEYYDQSAHLVLFMNGDATIVDYNQCTESYIEYTHQRKLDFRGQSLYTSFPEMQQIRSFIDHTLQTGETATTTEYFMYPNAWYDLKLFKCESQQDTFCFFANQFKTQADTYAQERSVVKVKEYIDIVLDVCPDAVFTINKWAHVLMWNKSAERIFGWTKEEMYGKNIIIILATPERRQDLYDMLKTFLETKDEKVLDFTTHRDAMCKDGTRKPVEVTYKWHMFRGESYFTAYIKDLTQQVHDQNLLQQGTSVFNAVMTLIEKSKAYFYIADKNGNYTYHNKNSADLHGYTQEEMVGMTMSDLYPIENQEQMKQVATELETQKQPKLFYMDVVVKGETRRHFSTLCPLLKFEDDYNGYCAITWDVTEQTELGIKLEALLSVIERSGAHFYIVDKDFRFVYANGPSVTFIGQNPIGKSITDVFETNTAQDFTNELKHVLEKKETFTSKTATIHKGKAHLFVTTLTPIKDSSGNVKNICSLTFDVTDDTERSNMIEGILKLMETSKTLFYIKDHERRYTMVSRMNDPDYPVLNFIGKRDQYIFPPSIADDYKKRDDKVYLHKETVISTESWYLPDKTLTFVVTRTPKLDASGNVVGLYASAQDITEYQEAMEAKRMLDIRQAQMNEQMAMETSRLKSEFLANMSHEIRTPLNGIIGLLTLTENTNLNDEQKELVTGIRQSTGILLSIVNDILDFSRIDTGQVELEENTFNLSDLLKDLSDMYRALAHQKHLDFILVNKVPKERDILKSDYGRMRQIFNNILNNAIKFTLHGHVKFTAEYVPNKNVLRFEIEDTGIGMTENTQRTLFKPFTQGDATRSRRYGGSGLGLSISNNIVNMMHGKIGVTSKEGEGSTFWVELPYISGVPTQHIESPSSSPSSTVTSTHADNRRQVLVVEDNTVNRKVALRFLQHLGYKAMGCDNGQEALNLLLMYPEMFSIVLMDLSMPVMDGYEATKAIRKLPKPLGDIPIIAVTANVLPGEKERVVAIGMNDYMSKPITLRTVKEMLEKYIN